MNCLPFLVGFLAVVSCQVPVPNRPLGFYYSKANGEPTVNIELYLDLACPDSKVALPVMKQVADQYKAENVQLKIFIFPLPYHRNAFTAAIVSNFYFPWVYNLANDSHSQ